MRYLGLLLIAGVLYLFFPKQTEDKRFLGFVADPGKHSIELCWKDANGQVIGSLSRLRQQAEQNQRRLAFAMNAGMYMEDQAPLGLYIEKGKTLRKLNTRTAQGNFYLRPNGVFFVREDGSAGICRTEAFGNAGQVMYATQSGPMLVLDGNIHPSFTRGSSNLNVRNGLGLLPDGRVLMAISTEAVNLYDFAEYFKKKGCRQALYLDGYVSRAYYPAEKWMQQDGQFGPLLAVFNKP